MQLELFTQITHDYSSLFGPEKKLLFCKAENKIKNVVEICHDVEETKQFLLFSGCQNGQVIISAYNDDYRSVITELAILSIGAIHFPVSFTDLKESFSNLLYQIRSCFIVTNSKVLARWLKLQAGYDSKFAVIYHSNNETAGTDQKNRQKRRSITSTPIIYKDHSPSCLLLTSGSESLQKIVAVSLKNLLSSYRHFSTVDFIQSSNRYLNILPLYFSGGRKVHYSCLMAGKEIYYYDPKLSITDSLIGSGSDITAGTPFILKKLLSEKPYFTSPVHFICGGAYLGTEEIRRARDRGINVYNVYGLTETASVLSYNTVSANRPSSVGLVSTLNKIKLNKTKEILIKGQNVCMGYVEEGKIVPITDSNGWYNTRDRGYIDEDGYLHLTGRSGHEIKLSSGITVNFFEIENTLKNKLDVEECKLIIDENDQFKLILFYNDRIKGNIAEYSEVLKRKIKAYNMSARFPIHEFCLSEEQAFSRDLYKENIQTFFRKRGNVLFSPIEDSDGRN